MSRKTISQAEARALRRRIDELEEMERRRRSAYPRDYPGGTHLGSLSWGSDTHLGSAAYTARRLGHAVVVVATSARVLELYAIPHPEMPA